MATETQENNEKKLQQSQTPLIFEKPQLSDLEKIESKLNLALGKIEKFIKEGATGRNLKQASSDSQQAKDFEQMIDLQIKSLNSTLTANERNALRMSNKHNNVRNVIAVVDYQNLPVTYAWKLTYVNGVSTIVPDHAVS